MNAMPYTAEEMVDYAADYFLHARDSGHIDCNGSVLEFEMTLANWYRKCEFEHDGLMRIYVSAQLGKLFDEKRAGEFLGFLGEVSVEEEFSGQLSIRGDTYWWTFSTNIISLGNGAFEMFESVIEYMEADLNRLDIAHGLIEKGEPLVGKAHFVNEMSQIEGVA